MRDFDEHTITDAVVDRVSTAADDRTRQLSQAIVRHLHDLVREVEPTIEEWNAAVQFLTRTGQTCTPTRQEFILLSDALGVSMLVDAINHRLPEDATQTTVLGPFYVADPPEHPDGADISGGASGPPLLVEGVVRDEAGAPLAGVAVDTWQADDDGYYDVQLDDDELHLRARLRTGEDGSFRFRSVVPAFYPIPADGPVGDMLAAQGRHPFRPAHVHFRIASPGHVELVTHLFLAEDPYLDSDAVFGVKDSLVRRLEQRDGPDGPIAYLRADFVLAAA